MQQLINATYIISTTRNKNNSKIKATVIEELNKIKYPSSG